MYVYTRPETVACEQSVGYCARTVFREPMEVPVALRLRFYIAAQLFRCRANDGRVEIEITEAEEAAEGA